MGSEMERGLEEESEGGQGPLSSHTTVGERDNLTV